MAAKRRPPIGTAWRINAGGLQRGKTVEPRIQICSRDYPHVDAGQSMEKRTTFDELVIVGVLHVEAMGDGTYFLSVGDDKLMIRAKSDGTVEKGEWYR